MDSWTVQHISLDVIGNGTSESPHRLVVRRDGQVLDPFTDDVTACGDADTTPINVIEFFQRGDDPQGNIYSTVKGD